MGCASALALTANDDGDGGVLCAAGGLRRCRCRSQAHAAQRFRISWPCVWLVRSRLRRALRVPLSPETLLRADLRCRAACDCTLQHVIVRCKVRVACCTSWSERGSLNAYGVGARDGLALQSRFWSRSIRLTMRSGYPRHICAGNRPHLRLDSPTSAPGLTQDTIFVSQRESRHSLPGYEGTHSTCEQRGSAAAGLLGDCDHADGPRQVGPDPVLT